MNKTAPFDSNGNTLTNVVGSNTTSYAWDFENRLSSVTLPGTGGTVSFKYDPLGRRIYKSLSSGTSVYAYDGYNLVEETNATGGVVARYEQPQNIDEPLAMLRSSTTSYFHADGLGSVTSLSNAAGSIANTYTYDSFGKLTASSGSLVNPFQYTARESDSETGLYYYRARHYDPSTGRFLSEDPIGFRGGYDFYRYVYNNPVGSTDPTGQSPADVQRIRTACQQCTDKLTGQGNRLPSGAGPLGDHSWGSLLKRLPFGEVTDWGRDLNIGTIEGCRGQAEMAQPCLSASPTDHGWTFDVVPIWLHTHFVVRGRSSNPSDQVTMCDPWLYRFWTEPAGKK